MSPFHTQSTILVFYFEVITELIELGRVNDSNINS